MGRRLKSKGILIHQVINRSPEQAQRLAVALQCPWSDKMEDIYPDTDWVLMAVRDDAISEVAAALSAFIPDALVTHTSGATPGAVLSPFFHRFGVFYPLQTFSMERTPIWSKIPFCVDAPSESDVLFLRKIAKTIGNLVYRVTDTQRAQLHVAAVFANNFANHCFSIAEQILSQHDLPFEMLYPLMEETLAKALLDAPSVMQTGPAIRGDKDTIKRHLQLLSQIPEWSALYLLISKNINPDIER